MAEPSLLVSREGAVSVLTLNRPATKNALDAELVDSLGEALAAQSADAGVRAIVLGGAGGAFCSGVDLRSAAGDLKAPERIVQRIDGFHRLIRTITRAPQPVLCAVDGPAVGFGADLALACDLRVASPGAYFQEKFVALGLMPDGGGSFHLPRLVGVGRALEMLLLGTRIDADEALLLGLINRLVPTDSLTTHTLALAQKLAEGPPLAHTAIKRAVRAGLEGTLDQALDREKSGQLRLLQSADVLEAMTAFFERRPPVFKGE